MNNNSDDLFDAIELIEKEEETRGYEEGKLVGQTQQFQTGFVLGWQQACHIQQEIGRIDGLLSVILLNKGHELTPRLGNNIEKVKTLINDYPNWDPSEENLESKLATVFNKTKQILLKLKIPVKIIDRSVDSEF